MAQCSFWEDRGYFKSAKFSLQAGSALVAFDVALQHPAFCLAFASMVRMGQWLRFAERSSGFRCPNPTGLNGMGMGGEAEPRVY